MTRTQEDAQAREVELERREKKLARDHLVVLAEDVLRDEGLLMMTVSVVVMTVLVSVAVGLLGGYSARGMLG